MYAPKITTFTVAKTVDLPDSTAQLWTDLTSDSLITYLHALAITPTGAGQPTLYITAERSVMSDPDEPKYMLCIFEGGVHGNHGVIEGLANLDIFEHHALRLATQRLDGNPETTPPCA